MIDNRQPVDTSVDRREETVSTQQPGFASTEQVTRDVAAERRQGNELMNQILYTLLGILEIGLGLRLVLKLIAANAASGFAEFIYGITGAVCRPLRRTGRHARRRRKYSGDHHAHRHGGLCAARLDHPPGSCHRHGPSQRALGLAND